jgi:hypothetical protein
MNIATTNFPEAALIVSSALQRERVDARAGYLMALADIRRFRHEAKVLRKYIDHEALWFMPCGALEDEVRDTWEAAHEACHRARRFKRMLARGEA